MREQLVHTRPRVDVVRARSGDEDAARLERLVRATEDRPSALIDTVRVRVALAPVALQLEAVDAVHRGSRPDEKVVVAVTARPPSRTRGNRAVFAPPPGRGFGRPAGSPAAPPRGSRSGAARSRAGTSAAADAAAGAARPRRRPRGSAVGRSAFRSASRALARA